MEPGVVEMSTNKMLMVIRTALGCQYLGDSADGGETWSTPRASELFSPEAPATLVRIPSTGDLLIVWNDHEGKPEEYRRRRPPVRTPLAVAISRDQGKTWVKRHVIEDAPDHGYCYTAVAFAGERVLLGYCAGRAGYGLETAQISSFALEDLYR
jgi:hypothetical protein